MRQGGRRGGGGGGGGVGGGCRKIARLFGGVEGRDNNLRERKINYESFNLEYKNWSAIFLCSLSLSLSLRVHFAHE